MTALLRTIILSIVLVLFLPQSHQGQSVYNRQYITVAGKKMSYKSFGLGTRRPGNPVLVFEAGFGVGGAINFTSLFPALSKTASGLGYDRNGEGESEQDTSVLTIRGRAQQQLRELARNRNLREFDSLPLLPDIPIAVLMAYNSPIPIPRDTASARRQPTKAVIEMVNRFRIENYQALLENNRKSYILLLPGYQHFIHEQNPALVITAIQGIYQKAIDK